MPKINKEEYEVWKDVEDYEGIYQVSNKGRIRSLNRPVIPKFVGEWIDKTKTSNILTSTYLIWSDATDEENKKLSKWMYEKGNSELFARAWLDGYEVEREPKYIISINITDKDSKTNYETFLNKRGIFHSMENDSFNSEEFNWSEEEIRGLTKGDILFEHFAVKVEELEE